MKKRKQIVVYLIVTLLLLFSPVKVAEAKGTVAGETETKVGFVEGDPEPTTESSVTEKPKGKLPSTGEILTAGLTGISVFIFAGVLLVYRAKRKKIGEK